MKKSFYFLQLMLAFIAFTIIACTSDPAQNEPEVDANAAEAVIDRAISAHGMEGLDAVKIDFTFRDRQYGIDTDQGKFSYSRTFIDSTGQAIEDVLTNDGLERKVDGQLVELSEKDRTAYTGSVNSVRYFFMLPDGLDEAAVKARNLEGVTIKGKDYNRVEVTFDSEGGGADHEDIYHYFFNRENGELDYLAYSFDTNDGGMRFREAINKRRVEGILIQDYKNYGLDGDDRDLVDIDQRFESGNLPLLSTIANTEVTIVRQSAGQ